MCRLSGGLGFRPEKSFLRASNMVDRDSRTSQITRRGSGAQNKTGVPSRRSVPLLLFDALWLSVDRESRTLPSAWIIINRPIPEPAILDQDLMLLPILELILLAIAR